jgi:hypothetical protein
MVLSAVCDATCWVNWFDGYFDGSNTRRTEAEIYKDYCENKGVTDFNLFILTPVNTWSNYSFVFFGSFEIALAVYAYQNKDTMRSMKYSS